MKKYLLIISFLFSCFIVSASELSEKANVYLFTCQPGDEIYATFGHSAFYIEDEKTGVNDVFNYGIFSFDADNFLYKFLKGDTWYMLGVQDYDYFLWSYALRNMGVYAQQLNLTADEKNELYLALQHNALPENREYLYNFFYDNCATRLRDMTEKYVNGQLIYPEPTDTHTYREVVEMFTGRNTWLKFGIDILVGAPADKPISNHQKMFLPYFLRDNFAEAVVDRNGEKQPLVISSEQLVPNFPQESASQLFSPSNRMMYFLLLIAILLSVLPPFTVMCMLLFIAILLSIYDIRRKKHTIWFDVVLFSLAGLIGCLVTFISFFSIHPAVFPNYNILWLHPIQLIFAVLLCIKKLRPAIYPYHYFNLLMLLLAFMFSLFAQSFNPAFYPLMSVFAVRGATCIYNKRQGAF